MHHTELTSERKSFFIKVIFFILLLILVGFMYLESRMVIDVVYFIVILCLFIRFLILKLYR